MFAIVTDAKTASIPSNTISTLKELHELTLKLEYVQQEMGIIGLEKVELEKEINQLKNQNEELIQENESYLESSQIEQQQISFLRSVSMNVNQVNLHNDDLNIKLSEYEQLIQRLKLKNRNLQKENEKYKIILEELNEEKQKRDEININNTLNLENKIKDLENECDGLREEINTIKTINRVNTLQIPHDEKTYISRPTSAKYKETNDLFRVKHTSLNSNDSINIKALFSPVGNKSNSGQNETEIIINTDDEHDDGHDIMDQLLQFGYNEYDINAAINTVHDKMDINEIVEVIQHNECDQFDKEIQAKMEEIDRLKVINDDNKCIIKTLQKRIKLLTQQNDQLVLRKKRNTNNRCILFNWFEYK